MRCPTGRPNIKYRVVIEEARGSSRGSDEDEDPVEVEAARIVEKWAAGCGTGKAIVYVSTRDGVERVGERLGCPVYHSKVGDNEEKRQRLETWRQSKSTQDRLIVATNALGLGIDVPDVRLVVHAGMPERMRDFVQESGRAGRDRNPSESVVVCGPRIEGEQAVQAYIGEIQCRRRVLDADMDGVERIGGCVADEQSCDICEVAARYRGEEEEQKTSDEEDGSWALQQRHLVIRSEQSAMVTAAAEEARSVELFMMAITRWDDFCVLCWVDGHQMGQCGSDSEEDAARMGMIQSCADELQREVFGGKRLQPYSGCFSCGLPQASCKSWRPEKDDSGRFRPSGQACIRRGIVAEIWGGVFSHDLDRASAYINKVQQGEGIESWK